MSRISHDIRDWLLDMSRLMEREFGKPPGMGVDPEARVVVEDIIFYSLTVRTPGRFHEIIEDMLYDEHPMFIDRFVDGIDNQDLLDLIDRIDQALRDIVPKLTGAWNVRHRNDVLYLHIFREVEIPPLTINDFKRHLLRMERNEGTFVRDTLSVVEEFEANQGYYKG